MKEISLENLIGEEDYIGYGYDHIILRNRRVELGLTQKEVADNLGISQSYISRLEKKIVVRIKKEMSKLA